MKLSSAKDVATRRKRGAQLLRDGAHKDAGWRMAVLSTFNVDLIDPFLAESFDRTGTGVRIYRGAFGRLAEEVLPPESALNAFTPDEIVLIPAAEDLLASLFSDGPAALGADTVSKLVTDRLDELQMLVSTLLDRHPAMICHIVVHGPERVPLSHVLAPSAIERGQSEVERFLAGVRRLDAVSPRVIIVDWDWAIRSVETKQLHDHRLWYLARMRLSPTGLNALAELVAQHSTAFRGATRKVAVVDLDDTLWGGVIGEVGVAGITLGEDGVGLAFQDFQRELLKLSHAGVLLAICSKNNSVDAVGPFESHPAMVLRREHFSAERINWQDKASNMRELAAELDLGLDSFVFFDDNPVEREWIRRALPEVLVPELPADPVDRPAFLVEAPFFQRIFMTEADARRADSYRAQGERRSLRTQTGAFEDFLISLEQEVTVQPVDAPSLGRAAQLCQRTNQFNLTTQRHTVADIEHMLADPAFELLTLAVRDRYGDSGITGLAILRFSSEEAEIDTLLLSCRVLGRRVEDAFLAVLVNAARRRAKRLVGRYVPTERNAQVEHFYLDRGFESSVDGVYLLDLSEVAFPAPTELIVNEPSYA